MVDVAVDAEGAVRDWCKSLGIPAALQPQRSGPAYLLLSRAGGLQESAGRDAPRISALAHSFTSKQDAAQLAIKFANACWNLTPGVIAAGVSCSGAEVESGPTEVQDPSGTSRYLVVASFYVAPTR